MLYECLFQDGVGQVREPIGQTCIGLWGFPTEKQDGSLHSGLYWLQVEEGPWYRFYADPAYAICWYLSDETGASQDFEECESILDLCQQYRLKGCKILRIDVERVWRGQLYVLRLDVTFSEGHTLRLDYTEDETVLTMA